MRLEILLPDQVFLDEEVRKVVAEAEDGAFAVYEHHVDYVTAIVPGILSFIDHDGAEIFLAVDEGVFVKCGSEVLVAARNAVRGPELAGLRNTVDEEFRAREKEERDIRTAVAKLEADLARRILELEGPV